MINWLGFFFLFLGVGFIYLNIEAPAFSKWGSNPFKAWDNTGTIGIPVLYILMLGGFSWVLQVSTPPDNWKAFLIGFSVVYLIALFSKWIAAQESIKKASIGDSIWAIFLGCLTYQLTK
jgi:hypothetical protein